MGLMPTARFLIAQKNRSRSTEMILSRIEVFPIKSLSGVSVERANVLASGALEHDRRFALSDGEGRLVNAKRTAGIHRISASFDLQAMSVQLGRHDSDAVAETFLLTENRPRIEEWFSEFFGEPIRLVEHADGGFPDDPDATGPTVISEATLKTVADWFAMSLDETRRRFRTNLEVTGTDPFWEDRLYAHPGAGRRFAIGNVEFAGVKPCQRCAVPPRDPKTGMSLAGFVAEFSRRREETLPEWAELRWFDHFYRLATNTVLQDSAGGFIQIGQSVTIG